MNKKSSLIFSIWNIIVIASTLMSCYLHGLDVFYQIAGVFVQNVLFYGVIFLPLFFLSLKKPLSRFAYIISISISFLIALVHFINALYFVRYKAALSIVDFEIFFQSNVLESIAFLKYYDSSTILMGILMAVVTFVIGGGLVYVFKLMRIKIKRIVLPLIFILTGVVYGLNFHRVIDSEITNPFLTGYSSTQLFKDEKNQFQINQDTFYKDIIAKNTLENDTNTIILILGESTQRHHMSLYGYPNKTTPLLDARKKDLVVFDDVISPDSHTFPVLKNIFSSKRNGDNKSWVEYPNAINVFKKAGYKTFWVSNQEANSIWGNTAKLISQLCDYIFYTERRLNQTESKKHDEVLLPIVKKIVEDNSVEKKLIIVHLMGTHGAYDDRYPESFNTFSAKDISDEGKPYLYDYHKNQVAMYDNAVLYNDFIINEIFSLIDNRSEKALCLYLSDHGEEMYDNRSFAGHSSRLMSTYMVEIPFIINVNQNYRTKNRILLDRLNAVKNRAFSSEDLPFLLYDVAGISTNLQDNKRNILHDDFIVVKDRNLGELNYSHLLQDKILREKQELSKIWVHRVNDSKKLALMRSLYKNVEVDIVLEEVDEKLELRVGHDLGDPKNFPLGEYLGVLKNRKPIKLWLDVKNVTPSTLTLFLEKLDNLIKENKLSKDQFLLESTSLGVAKGFMEAGYLASFYIWVNEVETISEEKKETILRKLLPDIKHSGITRLSFDYNLVSAATNVFEPAIPNIKFLSWNATKYFKTDLPYAFKQAENPLIDVFLIKFRTEYDR